MKNFDKELDFNLATRGIIVAVEDALHLSDEEFAKIRHQGFGASDSSKLLGVNPFPRGTAEELLQDKITEYHDEEIGKKASVRMGKDLEPFIIERTAEYLGISKFKPINMYKNPKNGLMVNFDAIIVDETLHNGFIPDEVKTVSFYGVKYYDYSKAQEVSKEHRPAWTDFSTYNLCDPDGIPEDFEPNAEELVRYVTYQASLSGIPVYYYSQLQQQIKFVDAPFGFLTALDTKTWTFYMFAIKRDPITIDNIEKIATKLYAKLKIVKGIKDE